MVDPIGVRLTQVQTVPSIHTSLCTHTHTQTYMVPKELVPLRALVPAQRRVGQHQEAALARGGLEAQAGRDFVDEALWF